MRSSIALAQSDSLGGTYCSLRLGAGNSTDSEYQVTESAAGDLLMSGDAGLVKQRRIFAGSV
jgi:hypothetical protein